MSFVMIASASGSKVRTWSVRTLVAGGCTAALALVAAGAGLGYAVGARGGMAPGAPLAAAEAPQRAAALPFALEQLGALSGRLFRLESQAAQLSKRIGVMQKDSPRDSLPAPAKPATAGTAAAAGGPMLPPLTGAALDEVGAIDARLAELEEQMALVADAALLRNIDFMRLPTRLPIANGELSSTYGNRSDPFNQRHAFHAGLDFAADSGTPILAAAGGTVAFAGFRSDYGWVVEIAHGNGMTTRYAHASKLLVRRGALVAPGERIALVGSTGRSTGPHLHFEVLRQGRHTDPAQYLAGL